MAIVIYVDALILMDFGMTFFILLMTAEVFKIKHTILRLIFVSLSNSMITLFLIIFDINQSFFIKMILTVGIAKLAFSSHTVKSLLMQSGLLLIISLTIGGVMHSSFDAVPEKGVLGALIFLTIHQFIKYYQETKWKARNLYDIELVIAGQKVSFKAFLDTGNFLTYGIKHEPVIIVSDDCIKSKIPKSLYSILADGKIEKENDSFLKDVRIIEYEVLGEKKKRVYGLKVKDILIINEKKLSIPVAMIIVSKQKFNHFDALIGLSALEGGNFDGSDLDYTAKSEEIFC